MTHVLVAVEKNTRNAVEDKGSLSLPGFCRENVDIESAV